MKGLGVESGARKEHPDGRMRGTIPMDIRTKRIYDDPEPGDGTRILVDRLWPRGVSKADAQLVAWMREIAPSDELRQWYDHDPDRWEAFRAHYRAELDDHEEAVDELLDHAEDGPVTLLYAATDRERNNAVVLREYLMD